MAALASIAVHDGTADQTFSARQAKPVAIWKDMTGGILAGAPTITLSVRETATSTRVEKRITIPILETVSGDAGGYEPAPKVAYTLLSKEEFVLPNRSTTAQRNDLRMFSSNFNAHAVMAAAIDNLEAPW